MQAAEELVSTLRTVPCLAPRPAHMTVDVAPTGELALMPTVTMPWLDPLPFGLAPAHTTVDTVPAEMFASTPTATVTWLAPLPSIVALVLPLAHTPVNLVPTEVPIPMPQETAT